MDIFHAVVCRFGCFRRLNPCPWGGRIGVGLAIAAVRLRAVLNNGNIGSRTMDMKYEFTLPSSSGADFHSAEHLPLVVYFYPKDSTPGCTTEGLDFNARLEQFEALGYTVVGISRDGVKAHQNFCAKQGFRFELLSDKDETVCRLFDVIKLKTVWERVVRHRAQYVRSEQGRRNCPGVAESQSGGSCTGSVGNAFPMM